MQQADSAVNTTLNTTTTSTNTLTDVHDKVHEKDEMLGLFIKLNDLIVGKVPFIVLIELINMAKEESIKIHEFLTQYQVGLRLPDEEKKYRGDIPMYYAGEDDLYLVNTKQFKNGGIEVKKNYVFSLWSFLGTPVQCNVKEFEKNAGQDHNNIDDSVAA